MRIPFRYLCVPSALLLMVLFTGTMVCADTISDNQLAIQSGGNTIVYDLDEVKIEVENGKRKVCICRCLCFRALQVLAGQFADKTIPSDDIRIYTGWTTDGPEELFLEIMGWSHDDLLIVPGATDRAHLTLKDAIFFFVQKSTTKAWKVTAREGLYPQTFFSYRTAVKTKTASEEEMGFFKKALRPQAVSNMASLPMIDKFAFEAVSYLAEDGGLHIPTALTVDGSAFAAELVNLGDGRFQVIQAERVN